MSLGLGNWLSFACAALVPIPGLVVRIRIEERARLRELGEPCRRFALGRARLVPRVW